MRKKTGKIVNCIICGGKIYKPKHLLHLENVYYCNGGCYTIARSVFYSGKKGGNYQGGGIIKKCSICSKMIEVKKCRRFSKLFYCSNKCKYEGLSKYYNGKNASGYIDGRSKKQYYCKEKNCNNKVCKKENRCCSCSTSLKWKNKEYREKVIRNTLKASFVSPNRQEKRLDRILNKLFFGDYKLNVKGEILIIGTKVPDFVNVNGQKKVIELYGDYWHSEKVTGISKDKEEKNRIKYFKKYGYKTLIIWEHELKDINKLKQKIIKFNGKKSKLLDKLLENKNN